MRVIAGTAHGTPLATLPGEDVTRPTIARVKEAMFSALQFQLPGAKVLDLFAGSGQLGIEALSRGAEHCTFIDQDKGAIGVITANCRAAGVLSQARILQRESAAFAAANKGSYHVVLLDPPYRQGTLAKVLPDVARLTAPGGANWRPTCRTSAAASKKSSSTGMVPCWSPDIRRIGTSNPARRATEPGQCSGTAALTPQQKGEQP